MTEKQTILIGGAPTAGKSTLARALSKHLDLPWISTDQIRSVMKATVRREDMPKLFNEESTAEKFLTRFSAEEIVRMEREQSEAVWLGVRAFIRGDSTWKSGFIIEGVSILPHLVAEDFGADARVKPIFLLDDDESRTRHVVFTRGLWDDAHTYTDDVKEKEVEWALLFGRQIREDAARHGHPCIDMRKNEEDLKAVLKALNIQKG